MASSGAHPALSRILAKSEREDLMTALCERLSGTELTTLLLEVARRRAAKLKPSDVLAQYQRDRFVSPATVDFSRLRAMEWLAIDAVSPPFTPVITAPVVPLGAHSVIAGVDQNRVVTTVRATEVAADPTNSLALEAAVLRRSLLDHDPRSSDMVRLAAVERDLRAQQFDGPRSFAHFCLLGLVTAGRDRGDFQFEMAAMLEHLRSLVDIVLNAGADSVRVRITDFPGRHGAVIDYLVEQLDVGPVTLDSWPERTDGRGYYPGLCFKLAATWEGAEIDLGDGGLVDWTQLLLQSRKERLMISGLSVERLALVGRDDPSRT
jgi:hypothetical protein